MVVLRGVFGGASAAAGVRSLGFDRKALSDPAVVQALEEQIKHIPPVDWSEDPGVHIRTVVEQVRGALVQAAPRRDGGPRAVWVSEAAWGVARSRGRAAGARRKVLRFLRRRPCRVLFRAWLGLLRVRWGAPSTGAGGPFFGFPLAPPTRSTTPAGVRSCPWALSGASNPSHPQGFVP